MRRLALMILTLVLALSACGGGQTPASAPAATPTAPVAETPMDEMDEMDEGATEAPAGATAETEAADTADTAGGVETFVIVPAESVVTYEVAEVFLREGIVNNVAVGSTREIEGEIMFDQDNPQNSSISPITIDISAFQSDSERRDQAIRDNWLQSGTYPMATFVPTEIGGLPESYSEGEEVNLQITGDLTVRDVTNQVTFDTTGTIEGNEMRGIATTTVQMTDYGFDPPDIAGILRAENDVNLMFEFVARANP